MRTLGPDGRVWVVSQSSSSQQLLPFDGATGAPGTPVTGSFYANNTVDVFGFAGGVIVASQYDVSYLRTDGTLVSYPLENPDFVYAPYVHAFGHDGSVASYRLSDCRTPGDADVLLKLMPTGTAWRYELADHTCGERPHLRLLPDGAVALTTADNRGLDVLEAAETPGVARVRWAHATVPAPADALEAGLDRVTFEADSLGNLVVAGPFSYPNPEPGREFEPCAGVAVRVITSAGGLGSDAVLRDRDLSSCRNVYGGAYAIDTGRAYADLQVGLADTNELVAIGLSEIGLSYPDARWWTEFTPPPPPQCSDEVDNDSDGLVDSTDPGCESASDNDETDEPLPVETVIVSMGDSVSAGEGLNYGWSWVGGSDGSWAGPATYAPRWYPEDDDEAQSCHRSNASYPFLVAREFDAALIHLACTGASAENGVLQTQTWSDGRPSPQEPQLGVRLINSRADIILMTLGANDVSFEAVIKACFAEHRSDKRGDIRGGLSENFVLQERNLRRVLQELRDITGAAGFMPTVYLATYYDPFPQPYAKCADTTPTGGRGLQRQEVVFLRESLHTLNEQIRRVASEFDFVELVDLEAAMNGHRWCSADPWVFGPSLVLTDFPANRDSPAPFHSTVEGHGAVSALFVEAIQRTM